MILGIGTDLVDERRIAKTLDRFGALFLERIFTPAELGEISERKENPASRVRAYASRFAAKEAASKALGTGLRQGISWQHMEILRGPLGKPTLHVKDAALSRLEALTPSGYDAHLHITFSDEAPYSQAFVIISAEKSAL